MDQFWRAHAGQFWLASKPWVTYEWLWLDRMMGVSAREWFGVFILWCMAIGGPIWVLSIAVKTYRLIENPVALTGRDGGEARRGDTAPRR